MESSSAPKAGDSLAYPDPALGDGAVVLRRWAASDIGCVEEASRDPSIPEGTTVPARFTPADGLAWIERQWQRADNAEGLSLAIADAGSVRHSERLSCCSGVSRSRQRSATG